MSATALRPPMPDTALAHAFLAALLRWAQRQAGAKRVMLPAGAVDADELRKVVVALVCASTTKSSSM